MKMLIDESFKKLSLIACLLFSTHYFSQNIELENAKEQVSSFYAENKEESLKICEEILPLALELEDTVMIAYFLDVAGDLNRRAGNYDKAINQLSTSLNFKVGWTDLKDLSMTYNDLGRTYINKGDYELAGYNLLEALKLMEADENIMGQGFYLNNLGALSDLQHDYRKGTTYYEKSLQLKESIQDSTGIAASSTNLGISYFNLGDLEKSLSYHQTAVDIYRTTNKTTKLARSLGNLGIVHLELNNLTKAEEILKEAYYIVDDIEVTDTKIRLINKIAILYLSKMNYDSAIYYNDIALVKGLEVKGFESLKEIYKTRSDIFNLSNQIDSALYSLNVSISYSDSLVNEANIYAVAEMEGKYEYEKNLRTIEQVKTELHSERIKLLYLTIIIGFTIAIVILFYVLYINKKRKSDLLNGQNIIIEKQNNNLEHLNNSIKQKLDKLQLTLNDKKELLDVVYSKPAGKELPPELLELSKREMEVLSHLSLGYSDIQLSEKLFISKATVKTHLRRIYSKLMVRGRAEAITIAHKYELIGRL